MMILKLFFLVSVVKGQGSPSLGNTPYPATETLYFPSDPTVTICDAAVMGEGLTRVLGNLSMGNFSVTAERNKCYSFGRSYSIKYTCDAAAHLKAKEASDFVLSGGTVVPGLVMSFYAEADCAGPSYNETKATCDLGCCKYTSANFSYFVQTNFDYPLCPTPTSAKEDPHLSNVKGEKFDILREGVADLVNVPKETAKDLKIQAAFNRVQRACSSIYITEFNLKGLWLKRNIAIKTVNTGNTKRPQDLSVMIDRQEMWPFWNITDTGLLITTRHGKKPHDEQGLYIKVQNLDIRMFQRVPRKGKGAWSYLNLDMKGLNRLASVGGILGTDDHSAWIRGPAECKHKISFDAHSSAFTPADERGSWAFVS